MLDITEINKYNVLYRQLYKFSCNKCKVYQNTNNRQCILKYREYFITKDRKQRIQNTKDTKYKGYKIQRIQNTKDTKYKGYKIQRIQNTKDTKYKG
jgi:hypothetical protein